MKDTEIRLSDSYLRMKQTCIKTLSAGHQYVAQINHTPHRHELSKAVGISEREIKGWRWLCIFQRYRVNMIDYLEREKMMVWCRRQMPSIRE